MFVVDLVCPKCGHVQEGTLFASYEEFKQLGEDCEKCGELMERKWSGRAPGAVWATDCPTASAGKGGCK